MACPPPHGTPPFAANRCSRQIQPTIPTETRIKSTHESIHFFACGSFIFIINLSSSHKNFVCFNTEIGRRQNLEEGINLLTQDPIKKTLINTFQQSDFYKMHLDVPLPSRFGKNLLENPRPLQSSRPKYFSILHSH